jgi:hypothetical protein
MVERLRVVEKKRTNSGPFRKSVDKPTFKGCLQRIDISGQILGSEQLSPKNCQENQRLVTLPLERGDKHSIYTMNKGWTAERVGHSNY